MVMGTAEKVVILLLSILLTSSRVDGKLVAATLLPHGDVAFDPTRLSPGSKARKAGDEIAHGARSAASWFATAASHDLDMIFLSTPHGIQLTHDFGIYLGPRASGSINITGDNSSFVPYTVKMPPITLDTALSMELVMELTSPQKTKTVFNVSGIATSADGAQDLPLEWAEIIPLKFLPEPQRHQYKYLIWSYPLRRYTESPSMVPELLNLGIAIREWMESIPLRIGVLISGDMSHTHETSGPYGYSNTSEPFDAAVGYWASNPCQHASSLLQKARSLQSHAMSCGFTGMILLHGMLCGSSSGSSHNYDTLDKDHVYVNRNATYYGMMAATFDSSSSCTSEGQEADWMI